MGIKVCIVDGCWTPTPNTRCAEHEREWQRARNADPARKPRRTKAYMNTVIVGPCACCGTTADLTRHHVDPLARGSGALLGPLVAMCRPCNSSIGVRVMEGYTCPMHGGVVAGG